MATDDQNQSSLPVSDMEEAAKQCETQPLSPPADPTKVSPNGCVSVRSGSQITRQKVVTALIICLCNAINFMDRYALPGN